MMLGKLLHSVMVGYSIDPDRAKIVAGTVDLILLVHWPALLQKTSYSTADGGR